MAVVTGGVRSAPALDEAPFHVDRDMVLVAVLHLAKKATAFAGFPVAVGLPHLDALHGPARVHILLPRLLRLGDLYLPRFCSCANGILYGTGLLKIEIFAI